MSHPCKDYENVNGCDCACCCRRRWSMNESTSLARSRVCRQRKKLMRLMHILVGSLLLCSVVVVKASSASTTKMTSSTTTTKNKASVSKPEEESWWIRIVETQHRKLKTGTNQSLKIDTNHGDDEEWGDSEWTIILSSDHDDMDSEPDPTQDTDSRLTVVPPMISSSVSTSTKTTQPNVLYTLPENQEFIGDWEMDHHSDRSTSSSNTPHHHHHRKKSKKKSDGWKYSIQNSPRSKQSESSSSLIYPMNNNRTFPLLQYDTRQRVWMRKVRYIPTATPIVSKQKKKRTRRILHPKTVQKIQNFWMDEFNFKGFGFVLYKSLIARKGNYGVGIRIPITSNWGFWERRAHWPSITCSMAVYYPWLFVWTWNASVRMEWIQWTFQVIHHAVPAMATAMFVVVLRGLALAVSALLFPLTRKPLLMTHQHQHSKKQQTAVVPAWKTIWEQGPRYSRTAEERIGISWNWRYTPTSFELRKQIYHQYMPSIAALVNQFQDVFGVGVESEQKLLFLLDWIRRRSAAFGWSITGPVPDPGFIVSMSGALTLSGLYPKPFSLAKISKKKSTSPTIPHLPPTPVTSAKSKLPAKTISESFVDSVSLNSHHNGTDPIFSTIHEEMKDSNSIHARDDPDAKLVTTAVKKATKVKGGGAASSLSAAGTNG